MKNENLDGPTSLLDRVYLECTVNENVIDRNGGGVRITCFCWSNVKKTRVGKQFTQKLFRGPTTWKDLLKNALRCNKKTEQMFKVSSHCLEDDQLKKEEIEPAGRSQMILKCLYLTRIGRLDILWSVNKLARSVTKWTRACDRRLARLISYIQHTNDNRQHCRVGNTAQHCRLGLFQDFDFAGDFEDSKSTCGESYVCSEVEHLFPEVGCARSKRQYLTVPQIQVIALETGLQMDGLLALDLWNVVIEVLYSS